MTASLRLELPALPDRVPSARGAITRLCEHLEVEDELTERVRLAVTEACTNCVLHAYGDDVEAATFALEARIEDDELLVVVRDSGVGLPGDRPGGAPSRPGLGLGLQLMRKGASSVDVSSRPGRGTRVAMRFALR